MATFVGLRTLHRDIAIRVTDALSGLPVQLKTNVTTYTDMDLVSNRIALAHHSAINQWYVCALNDTATVQSGSPSGGLPIVISGVLTTLPANVVQVPGVS